MITTAQTTFQQLYELSPIWLVNGIAGPEPQPITKYTENGATPATPDDYFAHFRPLPGSSIEMWETANYPLAALTVAANAVVQQPLNISLLMTCPAKPYTNNYLAKQTTMSALKSTLDNHILQGGWFIVYTPAYAYNGALLTSLRDVSTADFKQVQMAYQWDFVVPLIFEEQAQVIQSTLMNKATLGLPVQGQPTWSAVQ
jgi:hypothetical protein